MHLHGAELTGRKVRAVVQRVKSASVAVDGERVAAIATGLLVLVGVGSGDGRPQAAWLARKIAGLRIFADQDGRFDRSVLECGGEVLLVSQFTLYADASKGRRPSFARALGGNEAMAIYESVADECRSLGVATKTGRFGADMQVALVNDGPVTLILDSPPPRGAGKS